MAHKYAEGARVAVRHVRRDGLEVLKKMEKDHTISEDDHKRQADLVQKATDQAIHDVDRCACRQRKRDHDGVMRQKESVVSMPEAQAPNIAGTDPGVPRHVAIIMDGNGRWAASRGLPRVEGHRRGVEALRKTVRAAGEIGIQCLTIFSFSSENWQRPASEISDLMGLLRRFIRNDLAELHCNGVRVRVIGERDNLDPDIRRLLDEAEELTRANTSLLLVVAFNYGARDEIARAVRRIAQRVATARSSPRRSPRT